MNDTITVFLLVFLSAIAYAIPIIWVKDINISTSIISSLFALITLAIYALFFKNQSVTNISNDIFMKMIISGFCYGLGLLLYIEAIKYGKFTLVNLQTVLIFIMTTLIASKLLNEEINGVKIIGIILTIIGIVILAYGY